ncbi:MAG: phenylalanine--tRNA ligase subunit beta [Angustibacter sp.]
MRAPVSWLREYAPGVPEGSPAQVTAQVAETLVRVGLEEEGVHGHPPTGPVVVGRVLSADPEPQRNGKTIHWCQVHVGPGSAGPGSAGPGSADPGWPADADEGVVRGIVCGAPRVPVGAHVVVALAGAVLPNGMEIAARRTYGHVSDGMLCSERELGLGDDHDGIVVLDDLGFPPAALVPGADATGLLGLDEMTVEIAVTPDRGYCLSMRGIAREYAMATGTSFADPAPVVAAALIAGPARSVTLDAAPAVPQPDRRSGDRARVADRARIADQAPVRDRPGCDRIVVRTVTGFDPTAPTPWFIRRRLGQCGMRSISLAVDVTNYVMLATGQPLHAFDRDTLADTLVVRRARTGERLVTLDGVDRQLHLEDLLITDEDPAGASRVLSLAGVMGGAASEVSTSTTALLLEAAHFDPVSIARTARRHRLGTEASRRFERGVDPDLPDRALALAVALLVEHGGGRAEPATDVDQRQPRDPVVLPVGEPSRLIGIPVPPERVREALVRVGCVVADPEPVAGVEAGHAFIVHPPSWRPDLERAADLVEEIARYVGYDEIPSVLPTAPAGRGLTRRQRLRRSASRALAEHGLTEVLTYPFVSLERLDQLGLPADDPRREAARLTNPISEQAPLLRTTLLATLPDAAAINLSRGMRDFALFEIGSVVRPVPGAVASAEPASTTVGAQPSAQMLTELDAGVPPQPLRAAVLVVGQWERAGWWGPGRAADWTDAVGAVQSLARSLGVSSATRSADAQPLRIEADQHEPWHPGRCARLTLVDGTLIGHAGELAPAVVAALGLPPRSCAAEVDLDRLIAGVPDAVQASELSTHPAALRDVALVVPVGVPAAQVEQALRDGGGPLVEEVRLFDDYRGAQAGDGRRSLAYRLVLRAPDRTLTGEEAQQVVAAAVQRTGEQVGAVLRDV